MSRLRTGMRPVHIAEILASTEEEPSRHERHVRRHAGFPGGRARGRARHQTLRGNLRHATHTIRAKRADGRRRARRLGRAARGRQADQGPHAPPSRPLPRAAGGGGRPRRAASSTGPPTPTRPTGSSTDLVKATGETEVVKVKSMATQEIGLNEALEAAGIPAYETDLAELIVQLGNDRPSHILVPAIHRNRGGDPRHLPTRDGRVGPPGPRGPHRHARRTRRGRPAPPAREVPARQGRHLRRQLHGRRDRHARRRGVRGQRPDVPDPARDADLGRRHREDRAHLAGPRGLPADAAPLLDGRAHEPVHVDVDRAPPRRDGPQAFHLVLLDNGRTDTLADEVGRQALRCIRCSACLNVCPVYERAGGHAYGSVYPGPIGAILSPQLRGTAKRDRRLAAVRLRRCAAPATRCARSPSTSPRCWCTCGSGSCEGGPATREGNRVVLKPAKGHAAERAAMRAARWAFVTPGALRAGQRIASRTRRFHPRTLPGPGRAWSATRDLPPVPAEPFSDWWQRTHGGKESGK